MIRQLLTYLLLMLSLVCAEINVSIPHSAVSAASGTATLPVIIAGVHEAVGGLQLNLLAELGEVRIDSFSTPLGMDGWRITSTHVQPDRWQILLFHPGSHNLESNSDTLLTIHFSWPPDSTFSAWIPLRIGALTVSDEVGQALAATSIDGAVAIGNVVDISIGDAIADAGDTVAIALLVRNQGPLAGINLDLHWDLSVLTLVDATVEQRAEGFEYQWAQTDTGAWIWLHRDGDIVITPGASPIMRLYFAVSERAPAQPVKIASLHTFFKDSENLSQAIASIRHGTLRIYPGYLPAPADFKAGTDRDSQVELTWTPPVMPLGFDLVHYHLRRLGYAGEGTGEQTIILSFDSEKFIDTLVVGDSLYTYQMASVYAPAKGGTTYYSDFTKPVTAIPKQWGQLALDGDVLIPGEWGELTISLLNRSPIAGVRLTLPVPPALMLSYGEAILTGSTPSDWVVTISTDSMQSAWHVIALSPTLKEIMPDSAALFRIPVRAALDTVVSFELLPEAVVVSSRTGRPYPVHVAGDRVQIQPQQIRVQIGTGAPVLPGERGVVTLFMENSKPVQSIQLAIESAAPGLTALAIRPAERMLDAAELALIPLTSTSTQIVAFSAHGPLIPAGTGPVLKIVYGTDPQMQEGLIPLTLTQVVLADPEGRYIRQESIAGQFPVGRIQASIAPQDAVALPGRLVTVNLLLSTENPVCKVDLDVQYDPESLTLHRFRSSKIVTQQDRALIRNAGPGVEQISMVTANGDFAAGQFGEIIFRLSENVPADTVLLISIYARQVRDCRGDGVFAVGGVGRISIGALKKRPTHFRPLTAHSGSNHFIKIAKTTLGGLFLQQGDEVAVLDSVGEGSLIIVGAGVVEQDGSVNLTAPLSRAGSGGAQPGGPIYFVAWDRSRDLEGRPSRDADFILGAAIWSENSGLTIASTVRIPVQKKPAGPSLPRKVQVAQPTPNPFADSTSLRVSLPKETELRVAVFDLLGREIITLHDGPTAAGFLTVWWDGAGADGEAVSNGMAFIQVRLPDRTFTRKVILLR